MSRGYFVGLLGGVLLGVGIGLLIAPQPGYQSRRRVGAAARSAGDRVAGVAGSVGQTAKKAVHGIRQAI